jgi:hypothetical protein
MSERSPPRPRSNVLASPLCNYLCEAHSRSHRAWSILCFALQQPRFGSHLTGRVRRRAEARCDGLRARASEPRPKAPVSAERARERGGWTLHPTHPVRDVRAVSTLIHIGISLRSGDSLASVEPSARCARGDRRQERVICDGLSDQSFRDRDRAGGGRICRRSVRREQSDARARRHLGPHLEGADALWKRRSRRPVPESRSTGERLHRLQLRADHPEEQQKLGHRARLDPAQLVEDRTRWE